MTMAPLVLKNRVFVGNSGAEMGVRGFIAALDAETGSEVWRAWSTGPDTDVRIVPGVTRPPYPKDQGANLGVASWGGTTLWKQGGGTVWAWIRYDPDLNLLFHGTANPGVWNPDMRPGANQWATSMFARDPETGFAQDMYQMTPHDGWDYDGVNENIVADVAGKKLVVRFDRNGFAYIARSRDRPDPQCEALRSYELGVRHRPRDRRADPEPRQGDERRRECPGHLSGGAGRQGPAARRILAADGTVLRAHEPVLHGLPRAQGHLHGRAHRSWVRVSRSRPPVFPPRRESSSEALVPRLASPFHADVRA